MNLFFEIGTASGEYVKVTKWADDERLPSITNLRDQDETRLAKHG